MTKECQHSDQPEITEGEWDAWLADAKERTKRGEYLKLCPTCEMYIWNVFWNKEAE